MGDHDLKGPHPHGGPEWHTHGVSVRTDPRMLALALAINAGFMVVEVATGIIASSLALLSDAAHMLTDAGAIGMALYAARLAQRQAGGEFTFGLKRAEIVSAQANGLTLLILAALIVYEGVRRLISPPDVEASLMLWVGIAGIGVNLAAAVALAKANRESLNVEGAFQHNLMDAYASLGTAVAAGVILLSGFNRADPIASLLIAVLMVRSGYKLVRASGRIFMEAAPEGLDPSAIGNALAERPGVVQVHDLHVWEITSGFPALSAHLLVSPDCDCHAARREAEAMLRERFEIDHCTLQVEHTSPHELLQIEGAEASRHGRGGSAPRR